MDRLDGYLCHLRHPGREAIIGYERIRESWMTIFSDRLHSIAAIMIAHGGRGFAWVACTEPFR